MPGTVYPSQIDGYSSLPVVVDRVSPVRADDINRIRDTAIAIEEELGINPSSTYATVRSRLDALEELLMRLYILDEPGDILTFDGTIPATLEVGPDGYYLVADSTAPLGMRWGEIVDDDGYGNVAGTGEAGRVAFWSSSSGITSDADLTFDGTDLTVGGEVITGVGIRFPDDTVQTTAATGSGGANTELSNLDEITQVNTTLLPDTDDSYDVGSSSLRWQDGYFTALHTTHGVRFGDGTVQTTALSGNFDSVYLRLDASNDPLTGALSVSAGSVGTPGINFSGDTNTGIYSGGADSISVATAGVDRITVGTSEITVNEGAANIDLRVEGSSNPNLFFVDASANAIGVGTNLPWADIAIESTTGATLGLYTSASGSSTSIFFYNDNNAATRISKWGTTGGFADNQMWRDQALLIGNDGGTEGGITYYSAGTLADHRFYVGSSYNDGVDNTLGFSVGQTEVVVNDNGIATMDFRVESDTDANLIFADASTNRLGIGNGTPAAKLDLTGEFKLSSYIEMSEISAPAAPTAASGIGRLYVKTDGKIYFANDDGQEYDLTEVGSGGGGGGGGADTALSNLTPTTINRSLLPAIHDGYDIGSNALRWQDGYFMSLNTTHGIRFNDGTIQTTSAGEAANRTLSNLNTTAINTALLPAADDTTDLGSSSLRWRDLYVGPSSVRIVSTVAETGTARDWKLGIVETAGTTQGAFKIMEGASQHAVITSGGQLGLGLGSASAPTYSLASDLDTGMYSTGANAIGFATSGSNRLTIDDTRTTIANQLRISTFSELTAVSLASVTAPGSGFGRLYMNSSDNKLYFRNNSQIFDLTAAASGGSVSSVSGSSPISSSGGGTPVISLDDFGITAIKIAPNAVTFGRMQQINENRILGRDAGIAGDIQELTVGGGLDFTGAQGIQIATLGVTSDKIANSAITTLKIADGNVSLAKIENVNEERLLGRDSGVGAPTEITVGGGLNWTGTGGIIIQDGGVTTIKIADANVTTAKIVDSAITTAKLSNSSVTEAKLSFSDLTTANSTTSAHGLLPKLSGNTSTFLRGDGSWIVPSAAGIAGGDLTGTYPNPQIAAGAVGSTELATGAVTTTKIADNNITTSKFDLRSVTTAVIDDLAVTTGKIATNAVTLDKLEEITSNTILGKGLGPGRPREIAISSNLRFTGTATSATLDLATNVSILGTFHASTNITSGGSITIPGNFECTQSAAGVVLRSPGGLRRRIVVSDAGILSTVPA